MEAGASQQLNLGDKVDQSPVRGFGENGKCANHLQTALAGKSPRITLVGQQPIRAQFLSQCNRGILAWAKMQT